MQDNYYAGYGGLALESKKAQFSVPQRRRMNFFSLLLSFLLPWGLFCCVFCLLSFHVHYMYPQRCWLAIFGALALVLLCGSYAYEQQMRRAAFSMEREPSWLFFLFFSMLLAWSLAAWGGLENFEVNMQKYYRMQDMHTYNNIYPDRERGQAVMDVGIATFVGGSFVDVSKGMAFTNLDTYCVAPITNNRNNTLGTYDFWAAGKGCCTSAKSSFHCGDVDDPRSLGALRLLNDDDVKVYRLALLKAEATYNIKSLSPVFFEWVTDAPALVQDWADAGHAEFVRRAIQYGCVQAALVALAAVAFSSIKVI